MDRFKREADDVLTNLLTKAFERHSLEFHLLQFARFIAYCVLSLSDDINKRSTAKAAVGLRDEETGTTGGDVTVHTDTEPGRWAREQYRKDTMTFEEYLKACVSKRPRPNDPDNDILNIVSSLIQHFQDLFAKDMSRLLGRAMSTAKPGMKYDLNVAMGGMF